MKYIIWFLLCLLAMISYSQKPIDKPAVDTSDFENLSLYPFGNISNDGNYVICRYGNDFVASSTLLIKSTDQSWRREFAIPYANSMSFTSDSKMMIAKMSGDSLLFLQLGTDKETWLYPVSEYGLFGEAESEILIYRKTDDGGNLHVRNLKTNQEKEYPEVLDHISAKNGSVLLLIQQRQKDGVALQEVKWISTTENKEYSIWQGSDASDFLLDNDSKQLVFTVKTKDNETIKNSFWYYKSGMQAAEMLIGGNSQGIDPDLEIKDQIPVFSKDGKRLFFSLIEKQLPKASPDAVNVDVWNYKDFELQSSQMDLGRKHLLPMSFAAVVNINDRKVIRLQHAGEVVIKLNDEFDLVQKNNFDFSGVYTYPIDSANPLYLVSALDGSRKIISKHISYSISPFYLISPSGKWLTYYDIDRKNYFSYEMATGITRNISRLIPVSLLDERTIDRVDHDKQIAGFAGWIEDDNALLIYDSYDIWQVDPLGVKPPVNITNGYGRSNHICLRLTGMPHLDYGRTSEPISSHALLLLTAFNERTKHDGLCRKSLDTPGDPKLLTSGPFFMNIISPNGQHPFPGDGMIKARDSDVWLVMRQSFNDAPNLYISRDLQTYTRITDFQPQKKYNWLTAELMRYKKPDGSQGTAILYKPENFDPVKKYPLIFQYYEYLSDQLYFFPRATVGDVQINIPYYVSNGYIVCVPDMTYKIGEPGQGALNCIVGAVNYLKGMPWIDNKRIGINGHSFGGYETNYLVTHSHLFAAAVEAAGPVDFISAYGGLYAVFSAHFYYETGQGRIGATLWQRPDLYIKNSPVFKLDQVTTPLLIMHNKRDDRVPFAQGIELFTGLRRLGKPVWLLQYDRGNHVLSERDGWDFSIRTKQFFDYYLKGALPPKWMTVGVPARRKGIDTGYEPDTSGRQP